MSKYRFTGFPDGSTVTISTLKGGVAHGPVTVSAWKQATAQAGNITFEIYSNQAPISPQHQEFPYGDHGTAGGPNREILQGDVIEMVQYTGLGLQIDNVQGAALPTVNGEVDYRQLFFEVDFGERWDSEFITDHPYMPAGANTRDPDGATMGRYPGYVAGHVFRGHDINGNAVLTKDYDQGQGRPVGEMDITVTVTVWYGIHSAEKTFTVRLSHWQRYYTDINQTTYGTTSYRGVGASASVENRCGVIYVAADGDFTGAEIGPNIYHLHLPENRSIRTFYPFCGFSRDLPAVGEILRHTANATQIIGGVACDAGGTPVPVLTDFPWSTTGSTYAVLFKGGNTFNVSRDGLQQELMAPGANCLFTSWGSGRAEISGENLRRWGIGSSSMISQNASINYRGINFHNLYFHGSDLDITAEEWRIWWNVLYYEDKVGSFIENSSDNLKGQYYNGESIRNDAGTVWTNVISDWPVSATTGYLIVRQVLDQSDLDGDAAIDAGEAAFVDGDTITGATSGATCTFRQAPVWATANPGRFVPAASIQNRAKKMPPGSFWGGGNTSVDYIKFPGVRGGIGLIQCVFSKCVIKGFTTGFSSAGAWFFKSDTALLDVWDYGAIGAYYHAFDAAYVVANPHKTNPDSDGYAKSTGAGNSPNKSYWNSIKGVTPRIPARNGVSHAAHRHRYASVFMQHKCSVNWYGGHMHLTPDGLDQGWEDQDISGIDQPAFRMMGESYGNCAYVYISGGVYCGGSPTFQMFEQFDPTVQWPYWWVFDNCVIRAGPNTQSVVNHVHSRSAFKNCWIGFPSDIDMGTRGNRRMPLGCAHITFNSWNVTQFLQSLPDTQPVVFVEDTEFVYASGNIDPTTTIGVITEHRERTIPYINCTVTIGEPDSTPGVPAIPAANVAPIP